MPKGTTAPGKVWPSPPVPMKGSTAAQAASPAPAEGAATAADAASSRPSPMPSPSRPAPCHAPMRHIPLDRSKARNASTGPDGPPNAAAQNSRCRACGRMPGLGTIQMPAMSAQHLRPVPRRITLTDVARGCGVSRATVSLVLRGSPLVHVDTRARVEAELKRQGYVYHRGAANLRRKVSTSVALVINDLSNPFFAEFAA